MCSAMLRGSRARWAADARFGTRDSRPHAAALPRKDRDSSDLGPRDSDLDMWQNPAAMRIEDDNGISALLRGEETKLCTGFGFTEGPVWVARDNALLFSDIPGNRTHRWRPGGDGAEVYREPSGWSNGLTLDSGEQRAGLRTRRAAGLARPLWRRRTPRQRSPTAGRGSRSTAPTTSWCTRAGRSSSRTRATGRTAAARPRSAPRARRQELDFRGVYRSTPTGRCTSS